MNINDILYKTLNDEYNKHKNIFEDYPVQKIEQEGSIILTKPLLRGGILSLVVSYHNYLIQYQNLYLDNMEQSSEQSSNNINVSYTWGYSIFNTLNEVALAMKKDYEMNRIVIENCV